MARQIKLAVGAGAGMFAGLQCLQSTSGKARAVTESFVLAPSLGSSTLPLTRDLASAALRPSSPTGLSANSVGSAPYAVVCGVATLLAARRRREGRSDACATVCAAKKKGAEKKVSRKSPKKGKGGGGDDDEPGEPSDFDADSFVSDFSSKMGKAVAAYQESLVTIRAGRASPDLLKGITVSAFESELQLIEVASVTATDQTTLSISCFDPSTLPNVEKALRQNNDLGFGVATRGETIVLTLPQLTTDKRKQYVKVAKDGAEKARVSIRNVRQAAMKKIKAMSKSLNEDQTDYASSSIDDAVKKHTGDVDSAFKDKEKELTNE